MAVRYRWWNVARRLFTTSVRPNKRPERDERLPRTTVGRRRRSVRRRTVGDTEKCGKRGASGRHGENALTTRRRAETKYASARPLSHGRGRTTVASQAIAAANAHNYIIENFKSIWIFRGISSVSFSSKYLCTTELIDPTLHSTMPQIHLTIKCGVGWSRS